MQNAPSKSNNALIGMMTAGLGLYMTAAMWNQFNDALGSYFGPSLGVIIGTIVFMGFTIKRNELEYSAGSNYSQSERTTLHKDANGRSIVSELEDDDERHPPLFVMLLVGFIIFISEATWADFLLPFI